MTTITLPRAVVEQALEALKDDQYRLVEVSPNQYEYKTDLAIAALERALAQQAEPVEPVAWMYTGIKQDGTEHGPHLVWKPEYMDAMSASKGAKATPLYTVADLLRAQQAEPFTTAEIVRANEAWLHRRALGLNEQAATVPSDCADSHQSPGCDHCNHPLYAATRCRVCGRVTE